MCTVDTRKTKRSPTPSDLYLCVPMCSVQSLQTRHLNVSESKAWRKGPYLSVVHELACPISALYCMYGTQCSRHSRQFLVQIQV